MWVYNIHSIRLMDDCGVIAKLMNCVAIVREFEHQFCYSVHYLTNDFYLNVFSIDNTMQNSYSIQIFFRKMTII